MKPNTCPYCMSPIGVAKYLLYNSITCSQCRRKSEISLNRKVIIASIVAIITLIIYTVLFSVIFSQTYAIIATCALMIGLQFIVLLFFGGPLLPTEKK